MGSYEAKLYFLSPDTVSPSGGVRKIYRHVDILNARGFSAQVVHWQREFRCKWFENQTTVTYQSEVDLRESDYLVIPEMWQPVVAETTKGFKKVIFNQNAYYTFCEYFQKDDPSVLYGSDDVVGAITVSEDSVRYLQYAFPKLPVFRVHYGINTELFQFTRDKKKQICFMPRKNSEDARQVTYILKARNALADFELVPINNLSEQEAAQVICESQIFLSFGYPEGFGLPPAEAMASGSIVIGYHGNGGREFFKPEFSYPIEVGDIIGFAQTVEQVIQEIMQQGDRDLDAIEKKAKLASEYISQHYSLEREELDVVETWSQILSMSDSL